MNRLSTYFAAFSAVVAIVVGAAVLLVARMRGVVDAYSFLLLLPIGLVAFTGALLIGYLLATPLTDVVRKVTAFRAGNTSVDFEPRGNMKEADELAVAYQLLLDSSYAQSGDLARRERQQAQLVSDVAHELRTPLTAIHGTAELLADPDLPPELREKFSGTVVRESERLSRLVNDLLSLQHIEGDMAVHNFARVNLRLIAQEACDALAPVLEERGANLTIEGEAPDVLGNRDRLKQVVSNLVDNASRFVDPGGHVRVELYGVAGNSVVAVRDDGPGFGDVDPKLLFERFYRTDFSRARNTGGSGLGLAIVKGVVEAHDGTVEAYNLPEGGACFLIAIPSVAPS